ncbi:hypothetical protein BJY00DRAFT_235640 [Aspergillus carlsbadensis]|nr:hypothetical protein BJY00DRAFT_235640 [Aspergillus carlsbadensis]
MSTVCSLDLVLVCLSFNPSRGCRWPPGFVPTCHPLRILLRWQNMALNPDRDNGVEGGQGEDLKIILQVSFLVMSVFVLAGRWEGTIRVKADNAEAKGKEKEKPINDTIENHTYK